MTGILKVHLLTLERSAETLERIVYNALVELEVIPPRDLPRFEARIIRKLEQLDELQDEIDAVVAKLKATGEWEPADHSRNLYEYNAPCSKSYVPIKSAPAPQVFRHRRSSGKVDRHWEEVAEHMRHQGGTITKRHCQELLRVSRGTSHTLIERWVEEGRITPSHKTGKTVVYCAA